MLRSILEKKDISGNYTSQGWQSLLTPELWRHGLRVAGYATILYRKAIAMGLVSERNLLTTAKQMEEMQLAMIYHDMGKMVVPKDILGKPTRLDDLDWYIMRNHPSDGACLFQGIAEKTSQICPNDFVWNCCMEVIWAHHEQWNGQGYPNKLAGDNIPFFARLCAIADTYDAITSNRAYHDAGSHNCACRVIEEQAGMQFDPVLVKAFSQCKNEFCDQLDSR